MDWLRTAARLRVLSGLTPQQTAHVLACAASTDGQRREPVLPLLIEAGSDIDDGVLARACIADAGDGHGYRRPGEPVTFLNRLHAWSQPDTFYTHRLAVYRAAGRATSTVQHRRRRRRTPSAMNPNTFVEQLRAVRAAIGRDDPATNPAPEDAWWHLVDVLEAGFGDSWLLREAILATPEGLAPISPTEPQLARGTEPAAVAAWLGQAHHHNDNSQWWLNQTPPNGDSLATRTWLAALALFAKAEVVQTCVTRMEPLLAGLSNHEAATLIATVHRYQTHTAPRRLDLHGPLHSRSITLSAPAALLLYDVAFDSTRAELARPIIDKLADVLALRSDITRLALSIVGEHSTKPLRPNLFHGTRNHLDRGALGDTRIATINTTMATKVLTQPGQWPTDIVTTAGLVLSTELSKLPPLEDIAHNDHWFSGE